MGQGEGGQAGVGAEGVESGLQVFVPDDLVDHDRAAVVGVQRPVERVAEFAGVSMNFSMGMRGVVRCRWKYSETTRVSGRLRAAL
ncbi:hypothetical protein [Streptomyces levis]|uniref:hypothetical protein n=1 Tax=Streptomyces levis TaxID=285566 RepID=UPI003C7AF19E